MRKFFFSLFFLVLYTSVTTTWYSGILTGKRQENIPKNHFSFSKCLIKHFNNFCLRYLYTCDTDFMAEIHSGIKCVYVCGFVFVCHVMLKLGWNWAYNDVCQKMNNNNNLLSKECDDGNLKRLYLP